MAGMSLAAYQQACMTQTLGEQRHNYLSNMTRMKGASVKLTHLLGGFWVRCERPGRH